MPNDHQEQVRAFTLAVGLEGGAPEAPVIPETRIRELRVKLINEEAKEFAGDSLSIFKADIEELVKIADALADLLYVTYGAAVAYGIDIHPIFDIVHRANMKKIGGPKDPITGKALKPPDWVGPEEAIRKELERQMFVNERQHA